MTNNSTVGGILSIISGVFGILGLFLFYLFSAATRVVFNSGAMYGYYEGNLPGNGDVRTILTVGYIICGILCGGLGIVSIIGGITSIRKKIWGLALAGAITSIFVFFPTGIPAVIFTSIGKSEFDRPGAPSAENIQDLKSPDS